MWGMSEQIGVCTCIDGVHQELRHQVVNVLGFVHMSSFQIIDGFVELSAAFVFESPSHTLSEFFEKSGAADKVRGGMQPW